MNKNISKHEEEICNDYDAYNSSFEQAKNDYLGIVAKEKDELVEHVRNIAYEKSLAFKTQVDLEEKRLKTEHRLIAIQRVSRRLESNLKDKEGTRLTVRLGGGKTQYIKLFAEMTRIEGVRYFADRLKRHNKAGLSIENELQVFNTKLVKNGEKKISTIEIE